MSLRGAAKRRRSNLLVVVEIASGKEQERPRNNIKLRPPNRITPFAILPLAEQCERVLFNLFHYRFY
jgi:hypothetical protein